MSAQDAIARYLAELRQALPDDYALRGRVLAETQDHLDECVSALAARGIPEADAVAEAIRTFGTPQDVADRFQAEAERPSRQRWAWGAAALILVGLAGYGLTLQDQNEGHSNQSEFVQKPFTATMVSKIYDEGGLFRVAATTVEAYRSDGSRSSQTHSQVPLEDNTLASYRVETVDNRSTDIMATFIVDRGLISSHPLQRKPKGGYKYPFHQRRSHMCQILLSALEADSTTKRSTILGYDVLFHDHGDMYGDNLGGRFQEVWVAPELDCYPLRGVSRLGSPDLEKRRVAHSFEVVSVVEGDPSDLSFTIPAGLEEGPPSQIWTAVEQLAQGALPTPTRPDNWKAMADRRYRENRAAR